MLDGDYLDARARLIDPARAGDPGHGTPPKGGTVYLCAADRAGRMVSYIQSNFHGFGSGVVVPGTSITLHNRGAGFSAAAGHPNALAPAKRPFSTIIPAMLTTGDASPRTGTPSAADHRAQGREPAPPIWSTERRCRATVQRIQPSRLG